MKRIVFSIVSVVAVTLLIYNQTLIQEVKSQRRLNSIMKMDYIELYDEVLRLEEENQILGSFAAYKDTLK
jgi:hypothetical protein|tara:strand:+ start:855 stop:1064 length:210 start_codon:yes stop_codon:yes gene_type:complete